MYLIVIHDVYVYISCGHGSQGAANGTIDLTMFGISIYQQVWAIDTFSVEKGGITAPCLRLHWHSVSLTQKS